jgi:PAS domain S-box-containing protein
MSTLAQTASNGGDVASTSLALIPDLAQQLRVFKTLSSIIDSAYTFDSKGRFLYSNQALLDLMGLPLDEVIGKTFLELPYPVELAVKLHAQIAQVFAIKLKVIDETSYISPAGVVGYYEYILNPVFGRDQAVEMVAGSTKEVSHRKRNDEILAKVTAGERIKHYETTRRHKDGSNIDVALTISPIRNVNGSVIGTSKIARDISGTKKMERLLIQSGKLQRWDVWRRPSLTR